MVVAGTGGCRSVEWREPAPGVPASWRHLRLFDGPAALVLARDASAAAEAHDEVDAIETALAGELGEAPPRGLVLALSADDPLLFAGADEFARQLDAWLAAHHATRPAGASGSNDRARVAASGGEVTADATGVEAPPDRSPDDTDPEDAELALRLVAAAVPRDDASLGLPRELVDRAAFVLLLPTASCLDEVSARLVERALEREGIGWFQAALISAIAGSPASHLSEEVARQNRATLCNTWFAAIPIEPAVAQRVRQRAGVAPSGDSERPADAVTDRASR